METLLLPRLVTTQATAIGRDAVDVRLFASSGYGDLAPPVKVENAECVRARVGNISAMACWIDANEGGQAVDGDGCGDAVGFCVDYGDCAGLGVDDVDLVANRVGG